MSNDAKSGRLPADNPIRFSQDDLLGRADAAESFARLVLTLDASEGAAVGIFGPWGSGKTSFVNLARPEFDRAGVPVLDFNPWLFSGTEQLVGRFFVELSAQMSEKGNLENIVAAIGKYGDRLSGPAGIIASLLGGLIAGQSASVLLKAIGDLANAPESVNRLRHNVVRALRERDKPIVVVLDDVDRLSGPEIRDIFKLVRLTASFPNIVYIVPCDRLRVERALDEKEQGLSGSDYLEKIIQLSYDLPAIPDHLLREQIDAAIHAALDGIEECGSLDPQVWPYIRNFIVRPLIGNMRDVRRYAAVIRGTVADLGREVALVDVLGLEVVRLFMPDVFSNLHGAIDVLTTPSESRLIERELEDTHSETLMGRDDLDRFRSRLIDNLIGASGAEGEINDETRRRVVHAMIYYLFPAATQYIEAKKDELIGPIVPVPHNLTERRVAQESILRVYLERVQGYDLLCFKDAERAFEFMAHAGQFNTFIRSLDSSRWQDIISKLEEFREQFRLKHADSGVLVLLNLLADMPHRSPTSDVRPTAVVLNVVSHLLKTLGSADAISDAVERLLPSMNSLYSKTILVGLIGHREDFGGDALVSETVATDFETKLINEIRAAPSDELAREQRLAAVFHFARMVADEQGERFDIDSSPKVTLAVLLSGLTIHRTSSGETRSPDWRYVTHLYGNKTVLNERIENMCEELELLKPWFGNRGIAPEDADSAIELAQEYARGCRSK